MSYFTNPLYDAAAPGGGGGGRWGVSQGKLSRRGGGKSHEGVSHKP